MRAIQATSFGAPDVLELAELPDPRPGPGQLAIDVAIAPVLFIDTAIRGGFAKDFFPDAVPPWVPGMGVAGTVASVGEGVDGTWVGRRVVADTPGGGGYAERATAPADAVVPVPEGVDLADAAAVLHDGRTALRLTEVHVPAAGDWVLVTGAAGAAALLITQLAQRAGAHVIGAALGEQKLARARACGAEAVVDYTDPDWTQQVRSLTGGAGPRIVFDGVGGAIGQAAFDVVANGGRFSAHGTPGGGFAPIDHDLADKRGITVTGIDAVHVGPEDAHRLITAALDAVASEHLEPVVSQALELERAPDAHRAIEQREAIGKVLLTV